MWFDHVEHMEEGQEKNKEWENFWWTVDEDMFTYVMKSKIEELIEEKLNQKFPEEVETRENQDWITPRIMHLFRVYLHYISFALHLHFIYISHSYQNRYICITFH